MKHSLRVSTFPHQGILYFVKITYGERKPPSGWRCWVHLNSCLWLRLKDRWRVDDLLRLQLQRGTSQGSEAADGGCMDDLWFGKFRRLAHSWCDGWCLDRIWRICHGKRLLEVFSFDLGSYDNNIFCNGCKNIKTLVVIFTQNFTVIPALENCDIWNVNK